MNAPQKRPDFGRFVDAGCVQSRQEPAKNSRQVDAGARGETGDGVGQKFGHFLEHVRIVIGAENGGNRVAKRGSEEFRGNRRIYMKLPWRENLGGKAREGKGKKRLSRVRFNELQKQGQKRLFFRDGESFRGN